MEEQGLKIVVSADVRNALLNLSELTDATGELAVEGAGNLTSVSESLKALRAAQKEAGNPADLKVLNRAIKDLSTESSRLRNVGVAGFDEFGNKIKEAGKEAEKAGTGIVGFANSAFSSIRKIAYILPGIGIAGIFGLIGSGVVAAGEALGLFSGKLFSTSDAEKKMEEETKHLQKTLLDLKSVKDVVGEALGSEEGNIARVQDLARAIQDTNLSYKQRKNALTELKEINKSYFGDLTLEASSLKTLTARVQEYSNALYQQAIVKGLQDSISKTSQELNKQAEIEEKLKTKYLQAQKAADELGKSQKNLIPSGGTGNLGVQNDIADNARVQFALSRTKKAYDEQRDAVLTLRTAIASYKGQLEQSTIDQLNFKPLKELKEKADTSDKSLEGLLTAIKRVREELAKPEKDPIFKQLADSLASDDFNGVGLLRLKIKEAIAEGAKIGTADSKKYAAELANLYQQQIDRIKAPNLRASYALKLIDIDDKEIEKFKEDTGKSLDERMKRLPPLKTEIHIDPILIAQGKALKDLNDQINHLLKSNLAAGFENFGQSLGDAIAAGKNPIVAAGKSILTALGTLIQDIGKNLIEYGVAKQFLDTILSGGIAIPGIVAIGFGLAAEAIGALVKSAGSSYKAFADGGIITGPTVGLIGEAGPEVVFPLNQLNRFVKNTQGNGSQNINVTGAISGNNIRLALARTSKLQGLV